MIPLCPVIRRPPFYPEYVRSFIRGSPNLKRQFLTSRYVFIAGDRYP